MTLPVDPSDFLRALFEAALKAADPVHCLPPHLPEAPAGRLVVIGAGKAAGRMGEIAEQHYGETVSGILAVPANDPVTGNIFKVFHASHPVPDEISEQAGREALALARGLGPDDLVLAMISGGGSALMAVPIPGITLTEKKRITEELLTSGAPISAINQVRKALSAIKGGKLAKAARPARICTLIISDVPGDDPALVASGPTLPPSHRNAEAADILARYQIAIPDTLRKGPAAQPEITGFDRDTVTIIASGDTALSAAEETARDHGFATVNLGAAIEGEAARTGADHAEQLLTLPENTIMISGGETTVTIKSGKPAGIGGRNTEYLLALGIALEGTAQVHAIACDTDGIDGRSTAAGAVLRPDSMARLRALGVSPETMLENHSAAEAFEALGDLVETGLTGTNVNDFRAAMICAGTNSAHPL